MADRIVQRCPYRDGGWPPYVALKVLSETKCAIMVIFPEITLCRHCTNLCAMGERYCYYGIEVQLSKGMVQRLPPSPRDQEPPRDLKGSSIARQPGKRQGETKQMALAEWVANVVALVRSG